MAKLTKELQRNCIAALRNAAKCEFQFSPQRVYDLADALAACEVEEEPVTWVEARDALAAEGWVQDSTGTCGLPDVFAREDRRCLIWNHGVIVTKTRYCPPDLLDGRLKALEVADG